MTQQICKGALTARLPSLTTKAAPAGCEDARPPLSCSAASARHHSAAAAAPHPRRRHRWRPWPRPSDDAKRRCRNPRRRRRASRRPRPPRPSSRPTTRRTRRSHRRDGWRPCPARHPGVRRYVCVDGRGMPCLRREREPGRGARRRVRGRVECRYRIWESVETAVRGFAQPPKKLCVPTCPTTSSDAFKRFLDG